MPDRPGDRPGSCVRFQPAFPSAGLTQRSCSTCHRSTSDRPSGPPPESPWPHAARTARHHAGMQVPASGRRIRCIPSASFPKRLPSTSAPLDMKRDMEAVDVALSPVASTETGTSAATFDWRFENSADGQAEVGKAGIGERMLAVQLEHLVRAPREVLIQCPTPRPSGVRHLRAEVAGPPSRRRSAPPPSRRLQKTFTGPSETAAKLGAD